MKGIKILNISFFIIIVAILYLSFSADTKVPSFILLIFFISVFMFKRLLFNLKLRKNNILSKTKLPQKGIKDYFLLISIGTISFLLIINFWFSFGLTEEFTITLGTFFLFYFIGILNNQIILSNDYIVFNGHLDYAKWNKIVKFTIYNDILNLETPYIIFHLIKSHKAK